MKRKRLYVLFSLLCTFLIFLCWNWDKDIEKLYAIESSLNNNPAQAIKEINKFNTKKLSQEANALYCFLLTKSSDMQDSILFSSDSLIDISINYYKDNIDSLHLSQSYFYKGQKFRKKRYFLEASEYYQKAEDYAIDRDFEIKYLLNYSMGGIYHFKMMRKEEKEVKYDALHYALLLNDSTKIAWSYMEIAEYYDEMEDYKNCIKSLQEAIEVISKSSSSLFISINAALSKYYFKDKQANLALLHINQAISMEKDSLKLYGYFNLKADALLELSEKDSALYYFERSLESDNIRTIMAAYYDLALLNYEYGNSNRAFNYMQKYKIYRDSLDISHKERFIDDLHSIQIYKRQKESAKLAELELNHKKVIFYRWAVTGFLVIIILILLYYRSLKKKRLLELNIKSEEDKTMIALLMQRETEYKFLKEQEERKKVEVQQLHQTIEYYKRLNLITVPILLACQNNQGAVHLTKEEWNTIIENTNACFNQFTQRLKENYPLLTDEDVQFCCLVKMELSVALLSEIYHIAKGSISRRKMRLKEKMQIEDTTFDDFIKGF